MFNGISCSRLFPQRSPAGDRERWACAKSSTLSCTSIAPGANGTCCHTTCCPRAPSMNTLRVHHALPRATVSPLRKVFIDGALGQQVVWQQVPLAPGAIEVQESVDDVAHVHRSRSPAGLRWGKKRLQDMPLNIGEISQRWFASWGSHG